MTNTSLECPACGHRGKAVDGATVKSLLAVSLRRVRDVAYRFCATPDCDVVYFAEEHKSCFYREDVRDQVYQKKPEAPDVLICYCFQHTTGAIRDEITRTGQTSVIDDINAGIQAGQCACDWRNPQGDCCLGNVRQYVTQLQDKIISEQD